MANLRIPSHMTGEQYITKAALVADPTTTVVVFPGTRLILQQYRAEAERAGYTLVQLYNKRHRQQFTTEQQVTQDVAATQRANVTKMHAFLTTGIANPGRVTTSNDDALTSQTSGSTAAVAKFYHEKPREAESTIKSALLADPSLSPTLRQEIEAFYFSKGFRIGAKYALFWGRKSGEATGAGPWLDTNEVMLAQMMIVVRRKDPSRKIVIIGDPVNLASHVDGIPVPRPDIDLTLYWDRGFPGRRSLSAQLFFLRLIRSLNRDTVSIGTNSGILELPHLMGMKTVYLENEHLHKRKGLRWQMLAANYRFAEDPALLPALRTMLEGATQGKKESRIKELTRRIKHIERHKVEVVHHIRPGLQRFSTTTATELWSSRQWLFGEVRAWLLQPVDMRGGYRPAHDLFLDLVIRAAQADPEEAAAEGQQRPSWSLYHDARKAWAAIRNEPFSGTVDRQVRALRAMTAAMQQHGLTATQQERFWETFNYTFVQEGGTATAPDYRAGYRAWLKDTEEIWNKAKSRG